MLYPSSPGWRPGKLRVVARLGVLSHLKAEEELDVVDPGKPLKDWVVYEKPSSGVVVDLADERKSFVVPAGRRFLVRWVDAGMSAGESQTLKLMNDRGVTCGAANVAWLKDGTTIWTEKEFVAPDEEGSYELKLMERGQQKVRSVKVVVAASVADATRSTVRR